MPSKSSQEAPAPTITAAAAPEGRSTRSREKRQREEAGLPAEDPKPKRQTLGQYLADEREKEAEALLEHDLVSNYEPYQNYRKGEVLAQFQAEEVNPVFQGQYYNATNLEDGPRLLFLTLQTGDHPKNFTHFCNNTSLKWHLKPLRILSREFHFRLPSVVMLFVRGQFVDGTSLDSEEYKYVGIVGCQSVSSSHSVEGKFDSPYIYIDGRLVFDYVLSRADLAHFGDNVMKCKKNRYGCSLCS
jgi:hypothetical protein